MLNEHNKSDLENLCREFFRAIEGVLSWKWDSRFETALAEFSGDSIDKVRSILDSHFSIIWNGSTVGKAPDSVRMINSYLGGLMSGQLLFTSDSKDSFIFCAWWPWGDGKTISIRVAPFYMESTDSERAELMKAFRSWFRI